MTARAKLTVTFTGFWISGTGMARGRDVDVVTHRDRDHLPAMPMTQIKGQLRETAARLTAGGIGPWQDQTLLARLFGPDTQDDKSSDGRGGALGFRGEARLPEAVRVWLAHADQADSRSRLFARIQSTAIGQFGAALDHSLRSIEAVIPLTLESHIDWVDAESSAVDWLEAVDLACAATVAFGKLKADGYGRAIAALERVGAR